MCCTSAARELLLRFTYNASMWLLITSQLFFFAWKNTVCAGFRRERSYICSVANNANNGDRQRPVIRNIVAIKKAFDNVRHPSLWCILMRYGMPNDMIKINTLARLSEWDCTSYSLCQQCSTVWTVTSCLSRKRNSWKQHITNFGDGYWASEMREERN